MAAVIGALRVVLGADTAAFEDGLKNAQRSLSSFGGDVGKVAAGIGVLMVAAATGFAFAIKSTINEMDNLGKTAQKIGIPVAELSKLRVAAELADLSVEEMGKAVIKLSKAMEGARDPFNESNRAFASLGINVKDSSGNLKNAGVVIEEIAARFENFKDGAGKTAIAVALFGKAGADMIPFLNQGAEGIRNAKKEAEEFGLVISGPVAKQAEEFNDNLKRLGLIFQGIITQVTAHLVPALSDFSQTLLETAKSSGFAQTAVEGILNILRVVTEGVAGFVLELKKLANMWTFLKVLMTADHIKPIMQAWSDWTKANEETERSLSELTGRLDAFWGNLNNKMTEGPALFHRAAAEMKADIQSLAIAAEQWTKITPPKLATAEELAKLKQLAEQTANLGLKTRGLKGDFDALAPGFAEAALGMGDLGKAALDNFLKTGQLSTAFQNLNTRLLEFRGAQLVFENREPLVAWQLEMFNVELAMRRVGATAEEIARAQEKVGEKFGMTWGQIGANIAGTAGALSNLTGTFAKENKAMGIASKAFGIGQAIINTQIAVTKALATLPPPASYAAMAFAVAQGAAAIAAISAQGFAMGGSFRVGGSGGMDSTPVSFMATPGERVTVEPEGRDFGRGGVTTIELKGIRPRDLWTGDMLREAVEAFNAGHRDGYRLVFAQ